MSIASEISRLSSNISDSLDAVAAKGVTVPSDSNSDDLPGLIALIEQGSGSDPSLLDSIIDRSITSISYDGSTIGKDAFRSCTNLSSISFPNVTTVKNDAFNGTGIIEIVQTQFPTLRQADSRAFAGMTYLTRVFLPEVFIGQMGFSNCTKLKTAVIAGLLNTHVFGGCTVLEAADFLSKQFNIGNSVFYNTSLSTLILRANTLTPLGTIIAFQNTPFASGGTGGTLYVPQALISDYQAATNWSTVLGYVNNQILPIEGSIYETQYADGTPITA